MTGYMQVTEENLDLTNNKIAQLEHDISVLNDNINTLHEQMKDIQKYIVKLAHNQSEVTKRVSSWPFIGVSEK